MTAKELGDTPIYPYEREKFGQSIIQGRVDHDGMTLRQWYAGLAMQGLCASSEALREISPDPYLLYGTLGFMAVKAADGLLAQLAKEHP